MASSSPLPPHVELLQGTQAVHETIKHGYTFLGPKGVAVHGWIRVDRHV